MNQSASKCVAFNVEDSWAKRIHAARLLGGFRVTPAKLEQKYDGQNGPGQKIDRGFFMRTQKFTLTFQTLRGTDGNAVSEIQLFKLGTFEHWSGEEFVVDQKFMDSMIANFNSMKSKSKDEKIVPMDYNHGSLAYGAQEAKSAGWVLDVFKKEDGLYAKVEWTQEAADYIKKGEYRYISPEFSIDVTDEYGDDIDGAFLYAAALTNRPFLKGMAPVTLSAKTKKEAQMDKEKFGKLLALAGEYGEAEILAAIEKGTKALSEAVQTLGLKEGDDLVGGIKGVMAERDSEKAKNEEMKKEVLKLADEKLVADATAKVEDLIRNERLVPAQRDAFVALAKENPKTFEAISSTLPKGAKFTTTGDGTDGGEEEDFEKAISKRAEEKKISYVAAMKEIQKEKPELARKHANKTGSKAAVN